MDRLIGGIYRITEEIGHGSGGIVFKAYHERLKKYVVLKQLRSVSNPLVNGRNEADLLKSLHHTYLPQVYDFVEDNGEIYTVIDFIDGKTLKDYQNGKPLPAKEVKRISLQLCDAVNYLHTRETPVIHSDIKPSNIMIRDKGDICLIDFNISLIFNGVSGAKGGTKGFAAPEQLAYLNDYGRTSSVSKSYSRRSSSTHSGVISAKTDIYSIGAVMYFMLTGMKPDEDYNNIIPLAEFSPKPQPELCAVAENAMQLSPDKRYSSVSEMIEAINGTDALKSKRRRSKAVGAAVTAVCLATAVGVGLFIKGKIESDFNSKNTQYDELIISADAAIMSGDIDTAESLISSAKGLISERPEAYYEELMLYYKNHEYDRCSTFLTNNIKEIIGSSEFDNKSNFYFIAARSYFEIPDYKEAVTNFKSALVFSRERTDCYRDLAVSYAHVGDLNNAEVTLEEAENRGVANNQVLLARGEIAKIQGENETAIEKLFEAIDITDGSGDEDDYVVQRAVRDIFDICENNKELFSLHYDDVKNSLDNRYISPYYQGAIYARAGVFFMNHKKYEDASQYYEKANQLSEFGFDDYKNFVFCLRKTDSFDKALKILKIMEASFADVENYYIIPMNYSLVYCKKFSIDQQSEYKDKANEYYEITIQYYEKIKSSGKRDPNIEKLQQNITEMNNH